MTNVVPQSSGLRTAAIVLLACGIPATLFGLIWILTFYASRGELPMPELGSANLVVGLIPLLIGAPLALTGRLLLAASRRQPTRSF
ncbi:cell division protein CrgA [Agromyces endophyticus]|uniref:cell division protein CrgA n=1 Tax=Agromyces sp. H17E-10 TaxID=2932244 RepID=UPI001FD39C0D|nr:cell division protein CrgA [Agromyces sp. H17E-10]UOQ90171.1 cell division protein CrgA [Agromyces sp. H17E-10]